jgi:hypothetical protein
MPDSTTVCGVCRLRAVFDDAFSDAFVIPWRLPTDGGAGTRLMSIQYLMYRLRSA